MRGQCPKDNPALGARSTGNKPKEPKMEAVKLMSVAVFAGALALGCGASKSEEQIEVEAKEAAEALANALKQAAEQTQKEAEKAAALQREAENQADGSGVPDPKEAMLAQIELLKAGKADELKTHFTGRLQEKITAEAVKKGQAESKNMPPPAELIKEVQDGEVDGKKTAKILMPGGRTLTTLIYEDGKWLADTVWFQ